MAISRLNPHQLHKPPGYHHVTIAKASKIITIAGQCPVDKNGKVVSLDLDSQVDQVVANAMIALKAAGAEPRDVIRSVIYVVANHQMTLTQVWKRLTHSPLAEAFTSASTLLGVSWLGFPAQLVEVDLTAIQ